MDLKIKTTYSDFNKETGISTTVILTDLGHFLGTARLHPDDKETASRYAGCRYAEMRATTKYVKAKKKAIQEEIKLLNRLDSKITNKKAKIQIKEEKEKLLLDMQTCTNAIKSLNQTLKASIEKRDEFIKQKEN